MSKSENLYSEARELITGGKNLISCIVWLLI